MWQNRLCFQECKQELEFRSVNKSRSVNFQWAQEQEQELESLSKEQEQDFKKVTPITSGVHGLDFGFLDPGSGCFQQDQEWVFFPEAGSGLDLDFVFTEKNVTGYLLDRDENRSGLDQDWGQFWPDQDWIGLPFFFKLVDQDWIGLRKFLLI